MIFALERLDGQAVLLDERLDLLQDVGLGLGDRVVRRHAVVHAQPDVLGHRVDLDAALEVVGRLRRLDAVLRWAVDGYELLG